MLVPPTAPFSKGSLVDVLSQIPKLVTLYLKGNACVRDTKHYRKTTISSLPGLRYLDERPVFDAERFSTSAWASGGLEAERSAIRKLEENKRNAHKSQIERFAEWQKEVRAKRSKELEDHNASLRASGAPEVTELPRRSYVSYQRVSTKFQTETLRLQRLSERAEKMAKANGLHETAMMDLGREWWAEEGVIDQDGNLVNRYPDASSSSSGANAEDSQLPVRSVLTTEKGEEEEERLVMEEVLKLERKERARLRAAARRVDGGPIEDEDEDELYSNGSSLITSVNAPLHPPINAEAASAKKSAEATAAKPLSDDSLISVSDVSPMPTASEIRIKRSLEIFNERRRLAQLAEKKEEIEEVGGEETDDDEESVNEEKDERRVEKDKVKEFSKTREDFLARLADARKEAESSTSYLTSKVGAADAAAMSSRVVSAAVPSSAQPIIPHLPVAHSAATDIWSPQMDTALTKLVSAANFDFGRAARGLKSALLRGLLVAGGSVSPQAASELLDEDTCRLRFTAVTKATVPPSSLTETDTAAAAVKESLTRISGSLSTTSNASIPPVKVIRAGSGVGSSRAPMILSSNSSEGTTVNSLAAVSSSPLLSVALAGRVKPVSELLVDQFELRGFKDYVRVESLPTVSILRRHPLVEEKVDGDDEEEEEEEVSVLSSKEIMDELRNGGRRR
jgi:hypothetical protein